MKPEYTKANREQVDTWLKDPSFRALVERDLGTPISVKVLWKKGVIRFLGPMGGRELDIADILQAVLKSSH